MSTIDPDNPPRFLGSPAASATPPLSVSKARGAVGPNTTSTTPAPAPTQEQQGALDQFKALLDSWGLSDLYADASGFLLQGDSADEVTLKLQSTEAYQKRFAGNALRVAKGLSVLSPAQYIATEEQYRNVMQAYGLPPGFYDSKDDFTKMIGNDLSPAEVQSRAQIAHDQFIAAPDSWKQLWQGYGFTNGDAIASILDPNVATQVIKDRATQVSIGGAAADQGLTVGQPRAQQFQQNGVTLDKARQAYAAIASSLPTDQSIAQRFGSTFGQTQEENDLLLNDASANNTRRTMYDEETSLFKGNASANSTSLGVSQSY